jgi:magnesium-transporting ATPase (P-type)
MSFFVTIIVLSICIGGGLMFSGAILLFLSTIYELLFSNNRANNNRLLKSVIFFSKMTQIGVLIFLLDLAAMSFYMMIAGLLKGKYELSFSRVGRGLTRITWESQPGWFIVQTCLFAGFSIGIMIWLLKLRKNFFSRD